MLVISKRQDDGNNDDSDDDDNDDDNDNNNDEDELFDDPSFGDNWRRGEMTNGPNSKRPKLDPGQIPDRKKISTFIQQMSLCAKDVPTLALAAETRHQNFWLSICDANFTNQDQTISKGTL